MALTAKNILDRAAMLIQDPTYVRWGLAEMLDWLNDGRRELAVVRPDIYAKSVTQTLSAGAKQSLPADGLRLMDIPRNTSGSAITVTRREFLDQQQRGWHQYAGSTSILHFMLDERDAKTFWVYPPAASGASVEIIYQAAPTDFTISGQTVTGTLTAFEELYGGALVDYIGYRAMSKDSEFAGNSQRAENYYNHFLNALKIGKLSDLVNSANVSNIGGVASKQLTIAAGTQG